MAADGNINMMNILVTDRKIGNDGRLIKNCIGRYLSPCFSTYHRCPCIHKPIYALLPWPLNGVIIYKFVGVSVSFYSSQRQSSRYPNFNFGAGEKAFREHHCAVSACSATEDHRLVPESQVDAIIYRLGANNAKNLNLPPFLPRFVSRKIGLFTDRPKLESGQR